MGKMLMLCFLLVELPMAAAAERVAADVAQLTRALAAAERGDTVVMADGDWRDADIDFVAQGQEGLPITLRAQTPGKVRMTGRSRLSIGGQHLVVSGLLFTGGFVEGPAVQFRSRAKKPASHCRLTQCAIVDYRPADKDLDTRYVYFFGRHNRMDHCYLTGKANIGVTVVVWLYDDLNYHQIDHNHFGPRPYHGKNGAETIRIGSSSRAQKNSRTVVEHNYFEECNGEGETISSKSCENVFRYNTFVRCSGALTLRHCHRTIVEGNFFLGQGARGAGGVRIIGEDHRVINNYFSDLRGTNYRCGISIMNGQAVHSPIGYFPVKNALVAFNTIVNCRVALCIGLRAGDEFPKPPEGCVIANNLLVGEKYPLIDRRADPVNFTWQGNLAHAPELGIAPPTGVRIVAPKLCRGPDGLWRPAPDSPAVGAAEGEFPSVTDDIDGQPRGARKDVGCDQVSSTPALRKPLTPKEVGPDWLRRGG